jgi:hypothetical protein
MCCWGWGGWKEMGTRDVLVGVLVLGPEKARAYVVFNWHFKDLYTHATLSNVMPVCSYNYVELILMLVPDEFPTKFRC